MLGMRKARATKAAKVKVTGEAYVDLQLWFTARYLLGIGLRRRKGGAHPLLAAAVFAFFAFEAFLNEVGRQLDPDTWSREREVFGRGRYQGTLGKLRYLAEKTGFVYATDKPPFQTIRALASTRDLLAHGRVELFDVRTTADRADSIQLTPGFMKWGNPKAAKGAIADVEAIANGLMAAAKKSHGQWAAGYRSSAFEGITSMGSTSLEKGASDA